MLYLETPTNPTLKIIDIERLAKHAKDTWGSIVCVDNTFGTPVNQLPLTLGADIVLHSASKFLGGHADALGGVSTMQDAPALDWSYWSSLTDCLWLQIAAGDTKLIREVYHWREIHGACLDPHAAYMLLRGLKTLQLRVERQNASAMAVAVRHFRVFCMSFSSGVFLMFAPPLDRNTSWVTLPWRACGTPGFRRTRITRLPRLR